MSRGKGKRSARKTAAATGQRVTVTPQLRQWIESTARSGYDVPGILRLMRDAGYEDQQSREFLAEVLNRPGIAMNLAVETPLGKRTRHPHAPMLTLDGRTIRVPVSIESPVLRTLEGLLSDAECEALIELARPRLERARTVEGASGQSHLDQRRTSHGMFFALGETPLIERLEQRIAGMLDLPVEHGEGLQVLRYLPGQQYEPHVDWFDPNERGFSTITARGGQRVASVLMYLNSPPAGGGTEFPEIGLTVTALRGSAVYFAYEGGDRRSLHAGLPVTEGEKWLATKWLRERPYR